MAYKTTKIKSGMTLPKLAQQYGVEPAAILQANKIPKLSAGMVVKIPQPKPMQPGMDLQNPYNQFSPPVQSSFISGGGQVNYQTQANPIRSQGPLVNSGFSPVNAQNAYMQQFPSQGTVNQPIQPVGINAADRSTYMTVQNSVAQPATVGGVQPRPDGMYDPKAANAQDWLNYWNKLPVGTPKSNVYIPTKQDVWNMKVAARRRLEQKSAGDYVAPVYAPKQQEQQTGNASNQNVTWRIG